jgi:thiamine-monophosphate kinase
VPHSSAVGAFIYIVLVPLAEKSLIARIRRPARSAKWITAGIGDDCSVLRIPANREMLVTTDFSLEGVHFRRKWHPADAVGHRCLARGLSDIAAMGGDPIAAFLSLALPPDLPQRWVDEFIRGLLKLAKRFGVTLAGGDTAQSPAAVLADIVVVGSVPKRKAVLRSGARPGDVIYVTGSLGASAAAVHLLLSGERKRLRPSHYPAHFYPEARIEVGRFLRQKQIASSMIDISDGLSTDLAHICEESGVGAEVQADAIPRARIGRPPREVDLKTALHGGEAYELLFTVPSRQRVPPRIAGVNITRIGQITRRQKILLAAGSTDVELKPQGWEHFRS